MRYHKGELVFVSYTTATIVNKFWGIVLGPAVEDSLGCITYPLFRSDGKKRLTSIIYMTKARDVKPTYQGDREGTTEGGKPDPDVP